MMNYTVEAMMDFTDIHDNDIKYTKGQHIVVSEERALELFSSDYHLVKFIARESNNSDVGMKDDTELEDLTENNLNTNNIVTIQENTRNVGIINNLDSMNFLELKKIAEDKGLDVTLTNSKEKLKKMILDSDKE